ncbi:MAG: 16S rRNA (guanine(966)-N(2))-methyltransferase RsmD [Thermoanaerobaculia bacterium]
MTRKAIRISGGEIKGRVLSVPARIRPSGARLREALFDIWQSRIRDAVLLDLFAGSGAIGLEALSRGARRVVFVDSDGSVLKILRQNLQTLPATDVLVLAGELPGDLERLSDRLPTTADLIFADPPYDFAAYDELIEAVAPLLAVEGEMAIEHRAKIELPARVGDLTQITTRPYGDSRLSFYGRAAR